MGTRIDQFGRSSEAYTPIWGGYRYLGTFAVNHPNVDPNYINNARYHINGPTNVTGMTASGTNDKRVYVCVISSVHSGGATVGMADGAVKFLSENMDKNVYALLTRIADGQTVPEF